MEINLMIEGQAGVYWPEWRRLGKAADDWGFDGLYRSDHFAWGTPPTEAALELWVSLTWLASHTTRINFGSMVSPAAFRHPAMVAWSALQVDDLSGGRLRLGLGAGWNQEEHGKFGLPLLELGPRFDRFEEYLQVVRLLFRNDEPVSFEGEYYTLDNAMLTPRPQRPNGPPITVGGNGKQKTMPLAARYADEWNCVWLTTEQWKERTAYLDGLVEAEGRAPSDVRRTLMTGIFFGRDDAELKAVLARDKRTAQELEDAGAIVGTPSRVRERIAELEELGLFGVMLQWLDVQDFDRLEQLAKVLQ